jgi:parvulin-like peptidyl-prolyl isomerase
VANRFNPSGMIPPGGDIGFVQAGSLLAPLDDLVRTGALHQVHGPVQGGGQGWFLLWLEERKPQPQPPFDQIKDQLTEMMRQRKQQAAGLHAVDGLRSDYDVKVAPGAPQAVVDKFRSTSGPQAAPVPGSAPVSPVPAPPPNPEERKKVLANYRGGQYTLGEAYDDLSNPSANRPNFSVLPTVNRWIESQVLERVAQAEALKRHLNDEPEVQQRIRQQLDNFILDGYYQRQVASRIKVEPADVATAYELHKNSFARLQSARVVTVTMRDSAGAAALAGQAGHAPSLREAAATAAAGGRVREEKLKFPADSPLWTQFEGRMMSMNVGDIAGPFKTPGGWLTFQLLEKQQDPPPLDSLPPNARMQLQSVAMEMKREGRLAAVTDSLRKAIRIEVHEDRLRTIPWPPPLSPPGT